MTKKALPKERLMKRNTTVYSLFVVFLFGLNTVQAHPVADEQGHGEQAVMLAAVDSDAPRETFTGPAETKGVGSIEPVGEIELGPEFDGMDGRQLRARIFNLEPGAVIAIHTHQQRPGYAYILSGTIIEHRNDTDGAITHSTGSVAMEKSGVSHWWENTSGEPVRALVVDIFTPEQK